MRTVIEKQDALRPDPYLDWEVRTRPGLPDTRSGERWCSLYIKVKPAGGGDFLRHLEALAKAVAIGRLEEDSAQSGATIRMADDERQHLNEVIDKTRHGKIQPTRDKVLMQFFVYRPECLIYSGGQYASTEVYDAVLAGPPIAGLTFESGPDDVIRPTEFRPWPGIETKGVAIGIIDDGIAFAHERFRSEATKSRVMAIWLQDVERAETETTGKGRTDQGIAFGRRLDNREINDLLARHDNEADIYREIGLTDFGANTYNPLAARATHGTHVLDVAAGHDPAIPSDKIRPILAVQLPSIATIDTSGVTMGNYVLQAVRQIMLWAEKLGPNVPLVINFSYGLLAGPKDGTHELEQALNELISYRNEHASTCLVLPAGNTYRNRTTARMTLAGGEEQTLDWMILPDDDTPNFLEVWLDAELGTRTTSPIEATLTPPEGLPAKAARPAKGALSTLKRDGKSIAATYFTISPEKRGRIFIAVNQTASKCGRVDCAPAGRWRLTLHNRSDHEVTAHLYIQRDSTPFGYRRLGRQSFFDHADAYGRDDKTGNYDRFEVDCPITCEETLSALASLPPGKGRRIFVVGAAEASDGFAPSPYTSSGPTQSRRGPDCAAVTEEGRAHSGVLAAGTFGGSIVKMSGTSVAAPQLVRLIANGFAKEQNRVAGPLPGIAASPRPGIAERVPQEAAVGIPDQDAFSAPSLDTARLGAFVIQRRPSRHVPRRRYPAGTPDSNDEVTH